jgi:predicted Fe-Mo cluster-binding NifX family protein
MMKTAFAYWDNRIAPVFDTARQIHVVEAESGQIVSETQETLSDDLPVQKTLRLMELGIGTLVCGAISRPMHGLVAAYGMQVIPFVAGELREVIRAWLSGDVVEQGKAADKARAEVDKVEVAWADPLRLDPPVTAFVRNAGRRNHTNAACLASSASARSAEPS